MIVPDKPSQRRLYLAKRGSWSAESIESRSSAIRESLDLLQELWAARTVLAFWSMPERLEVDIRDTIHRLHDRGARVALPVVSHDRSDRVLRFAAFEGESCLVPGPFGTLHPGPGAAPIDEGDADCILVPALAADHRGYRLGWGGGYYDRLLDRVRCQTTICPIFDDCLVDSLAIETHDRPVALIVTERRTLRPLPGS